MPSCDTFNPKLTSSAGIVLFWTGGACSAELPQEVQEDVAIATLAQTIDTALEVNLGLKVSQEGTKAAEAQRRSQRTFFLPTLSASYQYVRNNEEISDPVLGVIRPETQATLVASITQPVFTGFAILNQYKVAKLGLDIAQIQEELARQDIVVEANNVYFQVLKAQKLLGVADERVKQVKAQEDVARNFYEVGMTPLNELLQAQVELANAKQAVISAYNNLETAKSDFNTFLRRPINTEVNIEDVLDFVPVEKTLDDCLEIAEANRLEIKVADLELDVADREVQLTKKNYYPTINLQGNYFATGTDPFTPGGLGIQDPDSWDVRALATWDFFQWGRTYQDVKAQLSRQSQAEFKRDRILDEIRLEVKQSWFKTLEAEKNINTIETAIDLARENLRINEERYKEQVATATDLLIAQTLLTTTLTNYYNALYDFKIAKAFLYRSMGQELRE